MFFFDSMMYLGFEEQIIFEEDDLPIWDAEPTYDVADLSIWDDSDDTTIPVFDEYFDDTKIPIFDEYLDDTTILVFDDEKTLSMVDEYPGINTITVFDGYPDDDHSYVNKIPAIFHGEVDILSNPIFDKYFQEEAVVADQLQEQFTVLSSEIISNISIPKAFSKVPAYKISSSSRLINIIDGYVSCIVAGDCAANIQCSRCCNLIYCMPHHASFCGMSPKCFDPGIFFHGSYFIWFFKTT